MTARSRPRRCRWRVTKRFRNGSGRFPPSRVPITSGAVTKGGRQRGPTKGSAQSGPTEWSDKVVRTVPCAALIQETPLPHSSSPRRRRRSGSAALIQEAPLPHRGLCGPLSPTSPAHRAALIQEAPLPHPSSTRRRRRSGSAALIQETPLPHRGLCGPLSPTSPAFLCAVKIRPADAAEHHGRLPLRVALLPRDQGQRFSADIADRFSRWTGRCSPPRFC